MHSENSDIIASRCLADSKCRVKTSFLMMLTCKTFSGKPVVQLANSDDAGPDSPWSGTSDIRKTLPANGG
jgi:hypothetical protein